MYTKFFNKCAILIGSGKIMGNKEGDKIPFI